MLAQSQLPPGKIDLDQEALEYIRADKPLFVRYRALVDNIHWAVAELQTADAARAGVGGIAFVANATDAVVRQSLDPGADRQFAVNADSAKRQYPAGAWTSAH